MWNRRFERGYRAWMASRVSHRSFNTSILDFCKAPSVQIMNFHCQSLSGYWLRLSSSKNLFIGACFEAATHSKWVSSHLCADRARDKNDNIVGNFITNSCFSLLNWLISLWWLKLERTRGNLDPFSVYFPRTRMRRQSPCCKLVRNA